MADDDFHKQRTIPPSEVGHGYAPIKIPKQIGPYSIEALLDKGGMGLLYLAIHPETQDPIIIKVLFPEFVSNPEMIQRFMREAEIIEMTDHPNIVKLYGQGEWEGGLYIAMEFIQGISLRQYLQHNLISLKHALEIIMEISMALCHLHAHGVIHRDLKPENILITESGGVKVIDFGIAQLLTEPQGILPSQKRRLIGTPIYMSPEQKDHPDIVSYPTDIYSLGIVAYELILGKLSHGQIHLSFMPKGLQKILIKTLQPSPQDRYQDIVDFMADLSAYINSPALLRENKELTPLSDLSESLRHAQNNLVPQRPPEWTQFEIGFAIYKNLGISNIYYDFFTFSEKSYGIIVGEPSIQGSPGIIYTSVLRGMVRALCQLTQEPEELSTILNALLIEDSLKQQFAFSYIVLLPELNKLRFISCCCGHLWHIPQGKLSPTRIELSNKPLGVDPYASFHGVEIPWKVGDSLIFYAYLGNLLSANAKTSPSLFSLKELEQSIESTLSLSPQKQVDTILRKAKISFSRFSDERALFLLTLQRKS